MLFLFVSFYTKYLIIPVVKEKPRVKLALAIPTGAPTTLTAEMIQTPPFVALKTIKSCLCNQTR